MRRLGPPFLAFAILLAVAGAGALLLVPETPAIGLTFGAASALVIVTAPSQRRPQRPSGRSTDVITRRGLLLAGVALILGAAEGFRRTRLVGLGPSEPPTPVPTPSRRLPQPSSRPGGAGLWLSPDEIAALPVDTEAFRRLQSQADRSIDHRDISNQDSPTPSHLMQVALVAARLDDDELRGVARDAIVEVIGSEGGDTGGHQDRNRPLGIGRNLPGYVIAADLIGLGSFDSRADGQFRSWIDQLRERRIPGADWSLVEVESIDHSNWGAHMAAALTAANLYLGDAAAVQASADMLRGWLGDPDGRQDWEYDTERHDYSWMCHYPDVDRFLPVNPAGCEREGMEIGGIIPIDMQRGDGFRLPPRYTQYPRETLQGRTAQAELLYRAGFDTWSWADQALLRIAERQLSMSESFDSDWYEPRMGCYWIIARRYDVRLPLEEPSTGRSVSGVDWSHGEAREGT